MAEKIMVASAQHDENGKYVNGTDGDQLQTSSANDTVGEVSMREMYTHKKGWRVIRLKSVENAEKIKERMITAANNKNIGYGQNDRLEIVKNGIDTTIPSDSDCGTLIRQAFKEATGVDTGDFTTGNAESKLEATGIVENAFDYVSQDKTPVFDGDILVTKTKGHMVVVVGGNSRAESKREEKYQSNTNITITLHQLKQGDYGIQVETLQRLLVSNGFDIGSSGIDGSFGTKTHNAVVKLQEVNGLKADGIVGKDTWSVLLL